MICLFTASDWLNFNKRCGIANTVLDSYGQHHKFVTNRKCPSPTCVTNIDIAVIPDISSAPMIGGKFHGWQTQIIPIIFEREITHRVIIEKFQYFDVQKLKINFLKIKKVQRDSIPVIDFIILSNNQLISVTNIKIFSATKIWFYREPHGEDNNVWSNDFWTFKLTHSNAR